MKRRLPALAAALLFAGATTLHAERIVRDRLFAIADDVPLLLDLHLPDDSDPVGLIIWVHGGAWRSGSKSDISLRGLVARGWAIASVDYRLSTVARFPAQVHDIKAAIRFLRAHAGTYGYPSTRFVIAGSSAGGHLAALVGVTNGNADLEGRIGAHTRVASTIHAIVDLYGASNLTTIVSQSTPHGLSVRVPALELLLGGQPEAAREMARLASPVFHVDDADPPLLLLHGDQDAQMPINQALELQGAYEAAGRPVVFKVIHGAGHGGPAFTSDETLDLIDRFLREHLRVGR